MTRGSRGGKKVHALDTNVLMHDPMSMFRFEEHDIFIAAQVLTELDKHKIGMKDVSRSARAASRHMRSLLTACAQKGIKLEDGIPLNLIEAGKGATGRLFFEIPKLDPNHPDDRIILAVQRLADNSKEKKTVVLVTKDNLAYVKAAAAGLICEDYLTDVVDDDCFAAEVIEIPSMSDLKVVKCEHNNGLARYEVTADPRLRPGGCLIVKDSKDGIPYRAFVEPSSRGRVALRGIPLFFEGAGNQRVWGIHARNEEQNFALAALLDPEVDCVMLTGSAGTGKTLAALAAGLEQVIEREKLYTEIIVTRVTVPVGEEIGFLPGSEEEKMGPWMGAFDDNLEVLNRNDSAGDWGRAATQDLIRSRIRIKSLNFMRGRTFFKKFVIIDEAQNLTPKQVKTLVTRAGPGTKLVIMGNTAQIDTPYLTENTCGLAHLIEALQKDPSRRMVHVPFKKGERSWLADWGNNNL